MCERVSEYLSRWKQTQVISIFSPESKLFYVPVLFRIKEESSLIDFITSENACDRRAFNLLGRVCITVEKASYPNGYFPDKVSGKGTRQATGKQASFG